MPAQAPRGRGSTLPARRRAVRLAPRARVSLVTRDEAARQTLRCADEAVRAELRRWSRARSQPIPARSGVDPEDKRKSPVSVRRYAPSGRGVLRGP
jgi:hypothetical protein